MDHEVGTDSGLLAPTWSGAPVEAAVTDEAWVRAMLEVEAALVRAQARLGLAPAGAAAAITTAAATARLDVTALARASRAAANPVVALVPAFTAEVSTVDEKAAEYVHRGSTSQDILDSAAMLIARRVLLVMADDLDRTASALAGLAEEHRATVLAGRTLAQHAVPTTFGLKAAGWLQLVLDVADRVRALAGSLPAQLGGAAGTMAAYQEYARLERPDVDATELLGPFAAELGLAEPVLSWHTVRTPIAELGAVLALVTGALGKIAVDVRTMSRTEIGELAEPAADGRGASSAMPQKRNPVLATLMLSAARQVPAHALILAQCMVAEDERPAGEWHAEWQSLREALRLAGGACHAAVELIEGLTVHPDRMAANLALTDGGILAERLNVALAPLLGKARAKKLLTAAALEAADTGRSLDAVLRADPALSEHLGELPELLDPAHYTGCADALIDRALAHHRSR